MTRVLIIEPAGNLWGSERALLDFVARIPDIETAVCCPPGALLIPELKKLSIPVFPYFIYALHEKNKLMRLWAAIGVIWACMKFRPDVIYLNQGGCYQVALPASILFGRPIVAHVRIYEDIAYLSTRCPNPRRLRAIIAISMAIAEELRGHTVLSAIPQHMIYDCYVPAGPANRSSSTRKNVNRVACVGRITPNKGQGLLIDAIHHLAKTGDAIDCMIAGDGPADYIQQLKDAAETGAGASLIRWLGVCSDVVPLLSTCAVAVCPSRREPLGRVVFEAWDAGAVPVACRTSGGAAEVINGADGGILYAEPTSESLATALRTALRLPQEETERLVGNGRLWMHRHCDPTAYGEAVARILRDAIDRHSGRIRCA